MAIYRIDVESSTDLGSVVPDVSWSYALILNQINEAEFKFSGTGELKRGLLSLGNTVYIYKNGSLVFKGLIDDINYFVGGTVSFHASGWEVWLAKENLSTTSSSPWTNTGAHNIFNAIIGESSYINSGSVTGASNIDFRLNSSQSLWNCVGSVSERVGYEVNFNYGATTTADWSSHVGSSTSVAELNDGKEINNLRKNLGYPKGNKIIVYGKGDGNSQIIGNASDATSIAAYGTITRVITDSSVVSVSEANALASVELAKTKDPARIYDFDLSNPDNHSLSLGDVVTLHALDQDVTGEEVRIVGLTEGEKNGNQFVTLQTTNPELKRAVRTKNKILGEIRNKQNAAASYMQGSSNINTWGAGINAKTSYPLRVGFYVSSDMFEDEVGNSNVQSLTVSYDIDPFKQSAGGASFDGTDPQVQNSSGTDAPDVANNSGSAGADVANNSGSDGADVANSSGSTGPSVTGTTAESGNASWSSSYTGGSASVGSGTLTGSWSTITDTATINLNSDLVFYYMTIANTNLSNNREIKIRVLVDGTYFPDASGTGEIKIRSGQAVTIPVLCPADVYGGDIKAYALSTDGDMDYEVTWNYQIIGKHTHADGSLAAASHTHSDGTYAAASHTHSDGTYAAASHTHSDGTYAAASHSHPDGTYDINATDINNISITDDVDEAGSVNASSVNLYLDFYNTATSSWDNKHSILATGVTIDEDVDLTNWGTYPDAVGWWRVRVEPITATADYAQAIVKMKNNIDN